MSGEKYLWVTGRIVGKTHFFEKIGRQGRRCMVPTYYAELGHFDGSLPTYRFAVTRDVSDVVFGHHTYRYGYRGECPPNRVCDPYRGFIDHVPRNGWVIRIYEPGFTKPDGSPDRCKLQGEETNVREHPLLHGGPGGSAGCLMVAGGKRGFARFRTAIEQLLEPDEELLVFIDPRPEEHHPRHLR